MNWYESKKKSSSSGGGHTILDDTGTALAQESNLQFNGTYTYDDSTNEKTIVEITRSMTKDQYKNLSDDEKLGVIEIIDEDDVKVCYDIEGVLRAGEDRITFSHEAINDNSTLDPYTNEVGVSPVNAFLSVDTSYTKGTIEVVTTSTSGNYASISVTYKDEEGSTISTQSLTYDDVTGEENAYVLNDILEVFYDSDNLSWVVKALSLCGYDGTEYETGDVISTWVYSESVDMEIEQYSTVGSVTYVFPVQNHDVAVKLRITSRDCGPIDIAPHIVDYSTEEQNTGVKWIDGKYVYQKTIVVQGPVTVSGSGYSINTGILSGGDLIDMRVTMQRYDTNEHFLNTYLNTDDLSWGTNCILNSDLTVLKLTGGNHYRVKNIFATLQYTKSTS